MKYNYYFLFLLNICLILPLFAAERSGREIMSPGASMLYYYAENNRWVDFEIHLQNIFLPKANNGKDYADENGLTLLHLAVKANQESVVQLLLSMGAEVETHSLFEKNDKLIRIGTPLHDAAKLGYVSIVQKLIAARPESIHSTKCPYNNTPLHIAAWFNQPNMIQLLLKNGANITTKNSEGSNAIHLAVWKNNEECLRALLNHGKPEETIPSVTAVNNAGNTPQLLATVFTKNQKIQLILGDFLKKNSIGLN